MKTTLSIAKRIAQRITGPYNQNVTAIFVGDTGSGKSYAALRLACDVSTLVAEIKGGKREDYFSVEKNMSVIDVTKFFDVLDNAQKWNTVILDDAGVSINARKFMDEINITVNNIIQTYRTLNLFTIFTVPQMFLIDKVSRALVNFYCELEGMVAPNISRGKLFELQKKSRLGGTGKLFYVYPRGNAEKCTITLFQKPPDDICKVYDKLREEGALEYKKKSIKALEEGKETKEEYSDTKFAEMELTQGVEIKDIVAARPKLCVGTVLRIQRDLKGVGIL
jgi:hypothetical protein